MNRLTTIAIPRSNDCSSGGFGFTLLHLVSTHPSTSLKEASQVSSSVVIAERRQTSIDESRAARSAISASSLSSSSSVIQLHQQEEQRQQGVVSPSSMKAVESDNVGGDNKTKEEHRDEISQPTDAISVKEVRAESSAYKAGLRPGDRILSVNNQSIQGKTYAQVIAIIQNTLNDLTLSVIRQEDDTISLGSYEAHSSLNRSSPRRPSSINMSKNTIEQKLRNLQINLAQGRTQEELAKAGIFFTPPGASSSSNTFSNYIDSVHRALDLPKQTPKEDSTPYYSSPYYTEYLPYEYQNQAAFQPDIDLQYKSAVSPPPILPLQEQTKWAPGPTSSTVDSKGPPTDAVIQEKSPPVGNDMKTEFVNFRKKQFETGHVENLVHDTQRESKTKIYSEKKKYENEWNRLTAVADVESVMKRAAHFEEIDPDKFARLKSKHPNSPLSDEGLPFHESFLYDVHPSQVPFYDPQTQSQFKAGKPPGALFDQTSSYSIPTGGEIDKVTFHPNPRLGNDSPIRRLSEAASSSSAYTGLPSNNNSRYPLSDYPTALSARVGGVGLIRQNSYIAAVRTSHHDEQLDFVTLHDGHRYGFSFSPETPILRRKVLPTYRLTPESSEQELKQRRTSYLIATDQRRRSGSDGGYEPGDFVRASSSENYSYDMKPNEQQTLRTPSQHQTQAIKKLKHFFGEGTPEVSHALDRRSTLPSPSSSTSQSKSTSLGDGSTKSQRESMSFSSTHDSSEASKEGILYCKTVLKDGRRATDRSWRGAWAVLRRGALFLGKEKKHGLLIPLSCDSFPISLHNADVELASDYSKKPRVFKLTTRNQCEFLFQAPDLQSLAEWLLVIKENCISMSSESVDQQSPADNNQEKLQRKSTSSLPPIPPSHHSLSEQDLTRRTAEQRKASPSNGRKSKLSLRSPSLKRSPSLRFRKSHKAGVAQPTQSVSSLNELHTPSAGSPRRSFKSMVKRGLQTLKSSSSLLSSQMSGQVYDESSGVSLSSAMSTGALTHGVNFGIELEECESSSISRHVPIVVEILTRLVELRGINCQGIYRHAGGLTAVNWLVSELDKGVENIDFNSEKWYDIKAVASTLKTFFAKLPDSLLSSKMSSLCVEASRVESHCHRLVELKRLVNQIDDHRYETFKYLCAHFRRVTFRCHINKIDARNLAIIFGPTLIWDSKASLQSNLVDNPEKIRIIESFVLYYEWFFEHDEYDDIPTEISPQMPKLPPVLSVSSLDLDAALNNESKPSEIIQQIVRAAKRRWSSPLLLDSLSSLSTSTEQHAPKPMKVSVKRNHRPATKEETSPRSRSVDSSLNEKLPHQQTVSSSTDSAVYSMSDISSSASTTMKKPSQSLKDVSHFFHYFTLSSDKYKSKTLTNLRKKKSRKTLTNNTFVVPAPTGDDFYERISDSSICFIDQSPSHEVDLAQQTSLLKTKLIEHESILKSLKQQIKQVDQQLLVIQEDSSKNTHATRLSSPSNRQAIKRRHTFNSFLDTDASAENDKHSSSSLYALQLL